MPSGFTSPRTPASSSTRSARSSTNGSDDGRAGLRHAYALANSCHGIGERILDLIDGRSSRPAAGADRGSLIHPDRLTDLPAETDGNSRRRAVKSFASRSDDGLSAAPDADPPMTSPITSTREHRR